MEFLPIFDHVLNGTLGSKIFLGFGRKFAVIEAHVYVYRRILHIRQNMGLIQPKKHVTLLSLEENGPARLLAQFAGRWGHIQ
jgi:hypothetical protein